MKQMNPATKNTKPWSPVSGENVTTMAVVRRP